MMSAITTIANAAKPSGVNVAITGSIDLFVSRRTALATTSPSSIQSGDPPRGRFLSSDAQHQTLLADTR